MPAELPLVVHERIKSADVLVAVDAAALRLGLKPGLALADARARLPRLYAAQAAPAADAALLDRIAADCDRYTPLVGRDAPDGVTLDITGAAHLAGGEVPLGDAVAGRLAAAGLVALTAIAGAPDTARALARYGRTRAPSGGSRGAPTIIVPEGSDAAAVTPLPVAALRLPHDTVTGLVRAGLKTIGCLARRPRAPLAARFGGELIDRLERTLGHALSPISPWRPQPVAHADLVCGEPIVRPEDIDAALAHLAVELAAELEPRQQGARRIEAAFFRVDGHVRRVEVAMARPSRDAKAVTRLFAERLAALASPLDPGFGFDRIRLAALLAEPLPAAQASLDRARAPDDDTDWFRLIDRLSARFCAASVVRFDARDSHIPERAVALVAATAHVGANDTAAGRHTSLLTSPPTSSPTSPRWPAPQADEPPARPASLFDPPQPIEAMAPIPDGPPLRFRWHRVVHDVVLAEGPERIAPEWWRLPPQAAHPALAPDAARAAGSPPPPHVRGKALPREDIPQRRPGSRPTAVAVAQAASPSRPHPLPGRERKAVAPTSPGKARNLPSASRADAGLEACLDAGGEAPAHPPRDWLAETRDYYRVEDRQGRRYWLFRAGPWVPGREPPRWFMHGLFA